MKSKLLIFRFFVYVLLPLAVGAKTYDCYYTAASGFSNPAIAKKTTQTSGQSSNTTTNTTVCKYDLKKLNIERLNSMTFTINENEFEVSYDYNNDKVTYTVADVKYKNNKITEKKYHNGTHKVADNNFVYKGYFYLENYFQYYDKKQGCPEIYLYHNANKEYFVYESNYYESDYRNITISPISGNNNDNNSDKNKNNNNNNNNCKESNAIACKKYQKTTDLYEGKFDIELGVVQREKGKSYYFNISKNDFSQTMYIANFGTNSDVVTYKMYNFMVRDKDFDFLFLENNTFPDDITLLEVDNLGSFYVYLTTSDSPTTDDYKNYPKPSDSADKRADDPVDNTKKDLEKLGITQVNLCSNDSTSLLVFQVIGYIIIVIKILVPIILIVLGSIDLGKASLSGDDKAMKDATVQFAKKVLIGLIIFFIPTVLDFFLSLIDGTTEISNKYRGCTECILNPSDESKCSPKKLTDGTTTEKNKAKSKSENGGSGDGRSGKF